MLYLGIFIYWLAGVIVVSRLLLRERDLAVGDLPLVSFCAIAWPLVIVADIFSHFDKVVLIKKKENKNDN